MPQHQGAGPGAGGYPPHGAQGAHRVLLLHPHPGHPRALGPVRRGAGLLVDSPQRADAVQEPIPSEVSSRGRCELGPGMHTRWCRRRAQPSLPNPPSLSPPTPLSLPWRRLRALVCGFVRTRFSSVARSILSLYFYWGNMAPLSRGTSATGLAVLVGLALACDLPVGAAPPSPLVPPHFTCRCPHQCPCWASHVGIQLVGWNRCGVCVCVPPPFPLHLWVSMSVLLHRQFSCMAVVLAAAPVPPAGLGRNLDPHHRRVLRPDFGEALPPAP